MTMEEREPRQLESLGTFTEICLSISIVGESCVVIAFLFAYLTSNNIYYLLISIVFLCFAVAFIIGYDDVRIKQSLLNQ